jgi:hypothetical protein
MKKICLSVVGIFILLFTGFSQSTAKDSSQYKSRKLKFEEANFVTSYYKQNGNNSAVTGGIGTEKLSDFSATFDVKFHRYDKKQRKNIFDIEAGIDHYTSASSDKVNPQSISSASHADTRIYPSVNWSRENENKGTTVGAGVSASSEYDYGSIGANLSFAKKTKNRNGEFAAKAQVYLDNLKIILPIELRKNPSAGDEGQSYDSESRNSFSTSLSYSQIINTKMQIMFLADIIYQQGYLGLPFHRVYFADNSVHVENLPDTRLKIPLGFRANYFAGDKFVVRSFYRFYHDDWGLKAHTAELETAIKVTPFFSISPFYRYYAQTKIDYFAPYRIHTVADKYYSSNYDLSTFNSNFYGAGFRIAPPKGVFGKQHISMLELRYGHYTKTNGMNSDIVSLHLKFK